MSELDLMTAKSPLVITEDMLVTGIPTVDGELFFPVNGVAFMNTWNALAEIQLEKGGFTFGQLQELIGKFYGGSVPVNDAVVLGFAP